MSRSRACSSRPVPAPEARRPGRMSPRRVDSRWTSPAARFEIGGEPDLSGVGARSNVVCTPGGAERLLVAAITSRHTQREGSFGCFAVCELACRRPSEIAPGQTSRRCPGRRSTASTFASPRVEEDDRGPADIRFQACRCRRRSRVQSVGALRLRSLVPQSVFRYRSRKKRTLLIWAMDQRDSQDPSPIT